MKMYSYLGRNMEKKTFAKFFKGSNLRTGDITGDKPYNTFGDYKIKYY